jgi:hypothetical protein
MRRLNIGLGLIVFVTALVVGWPVNALAQATQASTPVKPEALAGTYQGTASSPNGDMQLMVTLKYEKGAFSGTIEHSQGDPIAITGGTLTGDRLVLSFDMSGASGTITCTVKDPARVEGTWTMGTESGTVALTRAAGDAAKPATDKAAAGAAAPAVAGAGGQKPSAGTSADPITGQWDGVTGNSDMSVPFTMRLKLEGDKVTGDVSSDQGGAPLSTGTWKDGALIMSFELSGMGTVTMTGAIQEGKLVGSLDIAGQMQMQWAAVKKGT